MDNPELTLRYARAEQSERKKREKKLTGHFYTLIIVGSQFRVVSSVGEVSLVMEIMQNFWMVKLKVIHAEFRISILASGTLNVFAVFVCCDEPTVNIMV